MSPLPHNPNRATNPCSRLARVLVVLVAVCVLPTLLKAQIPVAEPVTVTDTVSFLDTLDNETITTTDAVTVTPLIAVAAPVVFYSAGSLGFNSVTTQSINVSAIGQAPLTLSSAAISKSSAFTVGPISCTNGATSLPTTLPAGGACSFTISFLSPSGTAASGTITFTDNAALSNVASTPAGSSFTQSIALNGAGSSTPPQPPPPAVVTIPITETITVTDTPSFLDALDTETISITDTVTVQVIHVTPIIGWATPASITYGTALSGTQLDATATLNGSAVPGTFVYTPTSGTVLGVGSQMLSVSFTPNDTTTFTTATAQVTLIVNLATATVSVTGGTLTYDGSPHAGSGFAYGVGGVSDVQTPAVTLSYIGIGATTYGPSATAPTNAGTYQVTASFAGNANYKPASNLAPITINMANQTITLTGVPSSPNFGQGPFSLSAGATSGLAVALSATGNCSLSANSLSLTGVGTCTVTATQGGNGNYSAAPTLNPSFTIGQTPTTTNASVSPGTVQYSDYTTLTATVTPISAGGQSLTGSVQFYLNGMAVGSPVTINTSGVATLSQVQVNLAAGSYPVKAVFSSTNANFAGSTGTTSQIVTQENAFILYSGDTIAQVGTSLNLRATVWDSAAAGYPGVNPESGLTATIGDITKMWIAFDIYPAGTCGSGTPSTVYAHVALTGTPGIGTATTALNSSSEVSYCVVSRLVAGNTGGTNLFYNAPNAQAAGLDFYVNSGQFATGGGWVNDPTGSHGNFGFNARYNSTGSPKGQMVYVYRALYNGVLADFIIKSNALTALQFTGTTYPISSTLQGKANVQVNRASDGLSVFSAGNYTFSVTVTDSGQNGVTGKQFSLIVYASNGVPYHTVPGATPLQGGNVVVHLH